MLKEAIVSFGNDQTQKETTNIMDNLIISKLKYLLSIFIMPDMPISHEIQMQENIRNAVGRVSSGNVNLQIGSYLTEEDIHVLKEKVLHK